MNNKPEYVYIMYPVPIEKIKDIQIPMSENAPVLPDEEEFMPQWYGNACFPEDEV